MSYVDLPNDLVALDIDNAGAFVTPDSELPRPFGWSLELDLGGGDTRILTDRQAVTDWGRRLCETIGMTAHGDPVVDQFGHEDLEGLTGVYPLHQVLGWRSVQRLTTSAAVVHCDPFAHGVHIDVFSCRPFNPTVTADFCVGYFAARCGTGSYRVRRVPSLVAGFQFDFREIP